MSDVSENVQPEIVQPTLEVAKVETVPAKVEEVARPNSTEIFNLAKREAALVKKELEYKSKLSEAEDKLKELDYFKNARSSYKDNPVELLEKLGIGYDDLTGAVIKYFEKQESETKPPSVEDIRKQVEEEFRKRDSDALEAQSRNAVNQFAQDISKYVVDNNDKLPYLTKLYEPLGGAATPEALVFEVVQNYYSETGQLLDLETAANTAEEYFREEWAKLNGQLSPTAPSAQITAAVAGSSAPPAQSEEVRSVSREPKNDKFLLPGEVGYVSPDSTDFKKFTVKEYSINNRMPRVDYIPYKSEYTERESDPIERGIRALENSLKTRSK